MPGLPNIAGRAGAESAKAEPAAGATAAGRRRQDPAAAPLHILHVFPGFAIGGAQVRFAALADGLGQGFRHTVISLTGNHEAAKLLAPEAPVSLEKAPDAGGPIVARLAQYRRTIDRLAPDLLVTYNWGSIEWAMANAVAGAPHIHIEDGFGPDEARRQLPRRIWARRLSLRGSTVVVPSLVLMDIAAQVWRLKPARVRYIPNGIEPQDVPRTAIGSLALDLPAALPRIVWAGALRREKNLMRLLHAFAPLKDRAVLLVIGEGPERAAIEHEIDRLALRPHVRLLGHRSDARDLMMQCQIMALSSDTEQMPLTVLEAMDAGLPVASVDVGDVRQMVAPQNQPFVVPMAETALESALDALLADAALRDSIGRANRARLRHVYNRAAMVKAYDRLFRRTAARSGRRREGSGR
jgi:glycosyltransferase involved in cell wall biosynthesis